MSSDSESDESVKKKVFLELKGICVPLLAQSKIDNKSIPKILSLLSKLIDCLKKYDKEGLPINAALVSYAFFPLSTLLTRNEPANIPDQVLERIFYALELLFRWWWWTCEDGIWDQVLMLSGSVIGGLIGKGKSRERADETKEAATRLLVRLLRKPESTEDDNTPEKAKEADARFEYLVTHAQSLKLVPVIGQTLNALLLISGSPHLPLQLATLEAIEIIVASYLPDNVIPSILPGVASTSTRIALGKPQNTGTNTSRRADKAWANGASIAASLRVLESVVLRAISDEACIAAGIVKEVKGLEDLTELISGEAASSSTDQQNGDGPAYVTRRIPSWLRASASQLLIAFNTLAPLLAHPNLSAQAGLASFSYSILSKTHLTLPDTQPLFLSFLLSLSLSPSPNISSSARNALTSLLSPTSPGAHARLQTLTQQTANNFTTLPHVLTAHDDAKIQHVAGQITAAASLPASRPGVIHLLGPAGFVEKWGTRLLSVLDFDDPAVNVVPLSTGAAGLLEQDADTVAERVVFPEVRLRHATTRETHQAIERMLRALGNAGNATSLFAVEWIVRAGLSSGRVELGDPSAGGALWCAGWMLEGLSGVSLSEENTSLDAVTESMKGVRGIEGVERRKLEKFARWVARAVTELWEMDEYTPPVSSSSTTTQETSLDNEDEGHPKIEHIKGIAPFEARFDLQRPFQSTPAQRQQQPKIKRLQPGLHKSFSLRLLAISAGILRSHFSTLLIFCLYPVLHSLLPPIFPPTTNTTSPSSNTPTPTDAFLQSTASSTLLSLSHSLGFASPRNLLLAHFDYALDSAARHLTRGHLDPHAARVLALLVRLAGKDAVERAEDVVRMCFDRLDDYHGYGVVVDGLVEALVEVVKVVAESEEGRGKEGEGKEGEGVRTGNGDGDGSDRQRFVDFVHWLQHRSDSTSSEDDAAQGNGIHPFPRENTDESNEEQNKNKGKRKEDYSTSPSSPTSQPQLQPQPQSESQSQTQPQSQIHSLTSQIVSRSLTLLTHGAAPIRTRVLTLLATAAPTLPADALLPAIHRAWPFVLNRLDNGFGFNRFGGSGDSSLNSNGVGEGLGSKSGGGNGKGSVVASEAETAATAALIAALAQAHGSFVAQRVWNDVWPRFKRCLTDLDKADQQSSLVRSRTPFPSSFRNGEGNQKRKGRENQSGGYEGSFDSTHSSRPYAYTHTHRLHRSILQTITAAVSHGAVPIEERTAWDVLLSFRPFLHSGMHSELQARARALYIAMARGVGHGSGGNGNGNKDAVWLVLVSTSGGVTARGEDGEVGEGEEGLTYLRDDKWDIRTNMEAILEEIDSDTDTKRL